MKLLATSTSACRESSLNSSSARIFVDAHFHLAEKSYAFDECALQNFAGTVNISSAEELERAVQLKKLFPPRRIAVSFGAFSFFEKLGDSKAVLNLGRENLAAIETALKGTSGAYIDAVGEAILDASDKERRGTLEAQLEIFKEQIKLAKSYNKCLVIHCVRCISQIFELSPLLAELPAVVFHGWGGTPSEAQTLLKRGVNCWFSLGTQLPGGKKSAAACAVALPLERILFETDFPYCNIKRAIRCADASLCDDKLKSSLLCAPQPLSQLETLRSVYLRAEELRQQACAPCTPASNAQCAQAAQAENLFEQIYYNFSSAFFNSAINSL